MIWHRKEQFYIDHGLFVVILQIMAAREKLELDPDFIIQFEETVTKLKVSGQINELTLDDLLCEVPHPKGYKMQLLKETKRSQRTLQPLQSFLLTD